MNIFSRAWNDIMRYSSLEQEEKLDYESTNVSRVVPVVDSKEQLDEILETKRIMRGICPRTSDDVVLGYSVNEKQIDEIIKVKKLLKR